MLDFPQTQQAEEAILALKAQAALSTCFSKTHGEGGGQIMHSACV